MLSNNIMSTGLDDNFCFSYETGGYKPKRFSL